MAPILLMRGLRPRLASCALLLLVLQCVMPFAAPIAACCAPRSSTAAPAAEDAECCPPGSHPPGECPLHKNKKSTRVQTSDSTECRMRCDGPHGPQLMLTTAGMLPPPVVTDITLASISLDTRDAALPASRRAFPDSPPPKLL